MTGRLRGLVSGQYGSNETPQRWRAVGDTVFDVIDPKIEPQTYRTDAVFLTTPPTSHCSNNLMIGNAIME